jgi:hypothetical protein
MIANKRVAKSLSCHLEGGNPSTYIRYMEDVKKYLIISGKRYTSWLCVRLERINEYFMAAWNLLKCDVKGISE